MKEVRVEVSLRGHFFQTIFQTGEPEYAIADEVYRLALVFANTRALAEYGRPVSDYEFAIFLEDMDYNYAIS